ncbi:hypothetical protein [Bailinhaonella thermotolerans]|uniref:Uncharacterized protein n=1 Tax=Bailinhaonella thermotolerans TaxID=1070861 RepID=A0A3A4AW69_9ACTN|nr:hypothetical protein [Bailinhaonella thermotolerans]RJL34135.1 hypothetical protein D5H75_06540 [Bailinhaonella thermotolerans]
MGAHRDLDQLTTRQLHDKAVGRAVASLDVAFLWRLLKAIPPAQAATGHPDEAANDVTRLAAMLSDAMAAGDGAAGEALRPLYLDYLSRHPDA